MKIKKFFNAVMTVLLTFSICLCLCSCSELDRLRERRAEWGDELQTVVNYRGEEYKLLPVCNDLVIDEGEERLHITTEEVPLLLGESKGNYARLSVDGKLIVSGYWSDVDGGDKVYARSDVYDELCEAIKNYELDFLCIKYGYWDGEKQEYISGYKLLSDEAIDVINAAAEAEGEVISEFEISYSSQFYPVYFSDETMRFVTKQYCARFIFEGPAGYMIYIRSTDSKLVKVALSTEGAIILYNELNGQ